MKTKSLSILLMMLMVTGCSGPKTPTSSISSEPTSSEESISEESSSSEESSEPIENNTVNIIMAAATVPPVMSALECLTNGGDTYALIERGKTYSGIADTSFVNIGFKPDTNNSTGVTTQNFLDIRNAVNSILLEKPNAHFNFFTVDYKPWAPVKIASETHLSKDNFTVYMVEDGTATYQYVNSYYQKNFNNLEAADAYFNAQVKKSNELFDAAMISSTAIDSLKNSFTAGYQYTFALATHKNFVHLVQDKVKLGAKLDKFEDSIINQVYGLTEKNETTYESHVVYKSISERFANLSEEQKNEYLTLMFGQYKAESERLLNRNKLDDGVSEVPAKKLIFIGGRVRQSGASLVDSKTWETIPSSYNDITPELHQVFLNDNDYNFVINYLNDTSKYETEWANASQEVINQIKAKAFNYYIDYTYNLKLTYRMYGDEYDVLFKGHPAETFDAPNKWSGYSVKVDDVTYNFNKFMHALAFKFHSEDSEGKWIGVLPGGVAAENLAYLGVNTYLCGLASSTYTGYEKTSPIFYVLNNIDGDIRDDIAINQRYLDGELVWEEDDKVIETIFINNGKRYQMLSEFYKDASEASEVTKEKEDFLAVSNGFKTKFNNWVKKIGELENGEGASIDNIGKVTFTDAQLVQVRKNYIAKVDAYLAEQGIPLLDEETQVKVALVEQKAKAAIYGADDLYLMKQALEQLKVDVSTIFNS